MKDTIIKETGNSRFLRSNVAEDITFSDFIALLRSGQLPIDLAGINEEGIDTLGMPLRKSTLLDDETEAVIWGSPGDRKPTEALKAIFAIASEKAEVVTGTYTGDGAASRTISLGFRPKAVIVGVVEVNDNYIFGNNAWNTNMLMAIDGVDCKTGGTATYNITVLGITDNGFVVAYDKSVTNRNVYANMSGKVRFYIAIA